MAAQPADGELLIQEAISQRRFRRSGLSMAGALGGAVVFGVVGWLLVFHARLVSKVMLVPAGFPGRILDYVLFVIGAVAFVIAGSFLVGASIASPLAPWGNAAPGNCPRCGQPRLREDEVLHVQEGGSLLTAIRGTVTLCGTPECGYAADRVTDTGGARPA